MSVDVILPAYIDSTMISCFRTCPRRFFYEFILGLRPASLSIDLHAGAAFSGTLERFYHNWYSGNFSDPDEALEATLPAFLKLWGDFSPTKETPKTRENVWQALIDYVDKWDPRTDHVQPFDLAGRKTVEFSFAVPLDYPNFPRHPVTRDPFIYCGRIDLLGLYNGLSCVRDEKTAGKLEANWASKWDLRSQFLGYCWGVTTSGIPCSTAVIRGIILRAKSPIGLVEAVKMYGQWEIDRWFEQLRRDLWRMTQMWNENYWDLNLGDACTMWSGCSYADLCKSQDPSRWYDSFNIKRWNPLDRNPIDPAQGI